MSQVIYNYYCEFCSQYINLDETFSIACPMCHEYKGLVPVTKVEEDS